MSDHSTSQELLAAAAHGASDVTEPHITTCLKCQVLVSRLREGRLAPAGYSRATLSALRQSSPRVQVNEVRAGDVAPTEGDVWRTQAPGSLLVWVRRIVDADTLEVLPLTLDVEMADSTSLVVEPERTSWDCAAVLLVDYRTHVHLGALAERVGSADAAQGVQTLLAGTTTQSAIRIGPPILDPSDQRLEYRDVLRLQLSSYAPSVWAEDHPPAPSYGEVPKEDLRTRLDGVTFVDWPGVTRLVAPGIELVPCVKSVYLDSVVLVCSISSSVFLSHIEQVVGACLSLVDEEFDADAVAVFVAAEGQESIILRRSDLRSAIGLPSGVRIRPRPYLSGLGVVDILFKHFDRYSFAISWSAYDRMPDVQRRDVPALASEQVRMSADRVAAMGRAAKQSAKRVGYSDAVDRLGAVEAFVLQVTSGDLETALSHLLEDENA